MTTPAQDPPREPRHRLEEAFVLSAMLTLALGTSLALAHPGLLIGHFYREPLFGLVHVFTAGWISMMILGLLCRLSPMMFNLEPRPGAWGWVILVLWLLGAYGLVFHMARGEWFGVWTSALCSLAAAALLPVLHPGIVRRSREGDWTARYALAGMVHLFLAALLGTFLALNKHVALVPIKPMQVLGAHVHLAAGGWATFMILGFGRRLHPTLAPGHHRPEAASRIRFWLLEISLLVLVAGFLGAPALVPVAAPMAATAIGLHLWRPLLRFFTGRVTDRASRWASVAMLGLAFAAVMGVALAWGVPDRMGLATDRAQMAYGFLLLFGWITPAITALALKLFPLWVWQERFARDLGVRPVPTMDSLPSRPLQAATGWGLAVGTVAIVTAVMGGWESVVLAGVWIYAAGVFAFLANFIYMARWGLLGRAYTPTPEDIARFQRRVPATSPSP